MYIPRQYQLDASTSIFAYYENGGRGNPVVAMPTATGKSIVIALFIREVFRRYPGQRIIMLTHVKELIQQNAGKLREQWPEVPLGIFSAGLKQRVGSCPIVYGGIKTAVNDIKSFGHRDLLIVDEAHLISPKEGTDYQLLIVGLQKTNPKLKVIGFTATPWRMGQGRITEGDKRIFTDICYDLCSYKEFNKLIAEGYLVAPVPKRTKTELNVSQVKLTGGEFNQEQLQKAVDHADTTSAACDEIMEEGFDRNSWLIFASGVKHAEHINDILQSRGIECSVVHSKLGDSICDARIADFRSGKLRAIVNYGKLTTGFDHPPIDLIGMLRPTMSTGLWVQMLGRGTRPSPDTGKENCLVLDFARNTVRLGPINDPVIPRRRVKGDIPGIAPVRTCDSCGVYNHARATHCSNCGAEFPTIEKLVSTAATHELLRYDVEPIIGTFDVHRVIYNRRQKPMKPPMIQVTYYCNLQRFSEWICLEHGGAATTKAREWWKQRMGTIEAPPTTDDALKYIENIRKPKRIRVWTNKKYPEVLAYEY